jgi:hypothetical protein
MINQVMEKIKGFLLSPVETFRKSRGDEPVPVITYFIVLLVFNAILWGLMMAGKVMIHPALAVARLGQGADPLLVFITGLILVLVLQLFLILIWGLWLHIFSYIAGARKGIMETEKAVIYGSTPLLLIGWIPVIGSVIGGIWTIILTIIGLREMHEITTGKAVLAYVLAFVVIFIVLILIVGWLVIAFMSGINPSNAMNY